MCVCVCVYRQCETCCCDSEDDLKPSIAPDGATSSRSGRIINRPSAYKQSEEAQVIIYVATCSNIIIIEMHLNINCGYLFVTVAES